MTTTETYSASADPPMDGSLANGSGPGDPAAESTDPAELRAQLALAHDRLAFYEGFDRVIAENVRRSGELMLEMLAMRESLTANAERDNRQERDRIEGCLIELDSGLQAVRTQIDAIAGQVTGLRRSLGSGSPRRPVRAPEQPHVPSAAPASAPPVGAPTEPTPTGTVWSAPQVIDVIVHHVHRATTALSLQRYLGSQDSVAGVEAREFAEGVLRLQVTARQPLTGSDLSGWTEGGPFTVLLLQPNVVEVTLDGGA